MTFCIVFFATIYNRMAMHHGTIIIQEAQIQCAECYIILHCQMMMAFMMFLNVFFNFSPQFFFTFMLKTVGYLMYLRSCG